MSRAHILSEWSISLAQTLHRLRSRKDTGLFLKRRKTLPLSTKTPHTLCGAAVSQDFQLTQRVAPVVSSAIFFSSVHATAVVTLSTRICLYRSSTQTLTCWALWLVPTPKEKKMFSYEYFSPLTSPYSTCSGHVRGLKGSMINPSRPQYTPNMFHIAEFDRHFRTASTRAQAQTNTFCYNTHYLTFSTTDMR